MIRRPPRSTLFPTRRSSDLGGAHAAGLDDGVLAVGHVDVLRVVAARDVPDAAVRDVRADDRVPPAGRSEEHTSELQSQSNLVCRLLLATKKIDAIDV